MSSPSDAGSKPLRSLPTPPLIVLSVISCFIATAALVSAFTQVNTHFPYFIVPSLIGYVATIPYHVHMYRSAKAHRRNPSPEDPIFISNDWLLYNFLLTTLWGVIFMVNIHFWAGEGTRGAIVATIWSTLEWIVLLILVVMTIFEIRRRAVEGTAAHDAQAPLDPEAQPLLGATASGTLSTLALPQMKFIYFASYTICSIKLVLSAFLHLPVIFTVIAFFLTGPHHISLFIASVRPNSPFKFFPILAQPTPVIYAFFLPAIWVGFLFVDVFCSYHDYQSIVLGIFGGLEIFVLAYLALCNVLDGFRDGQIKL